MRNAMAALLLTLLTVSISAQPRAQIVFAFLGLSSSDDSVSASQLRVLENRLTTNLVQIAEQERFSIIVPRDRDRVLEELSRHQTDRRHPDEGPRLREIVSAHGLITGEVHIVDSRVYLDVRLIQTETGATLFAYSGEFKDYDHALSASSAAVYALFDLDPPEEVIAAMEQAVTEIEGAPAGGALLQPQRFYGNPQLRHLTGSWEGDDGIRRVRIDRTGTAVATLENGDLMRLHVSIEEESIFIRQDEPNSPKMYLHAFPYSIAIQVVELARPMRWTFRLSEDRRTLSGTKHTTSLQIRQGRVVSADNTYSRPAVWTRLE